MKKIEKLENAKEQKLTYDAVKVNTTFGQAYFKSQENDLDLINFDDVIWERDPEEIVKECKEAGISMITISSGMSSMIEVLAAFDQLGSKIVGMTSIKTRYFTYDEEGNRIRETKPAVIIKI